MEVQNSLVQNYIEELNNLRIPNNKEDIFSFLSSIENKELLKFILSQSHIFNSMVSILNTYNHNDFYFDAGYSDRTGNIVPKLDNDGKLIFEPYTSHNTIYKGCRTILLSLQSDDKTTWNEFTNYIKRIYEPQKMDIYHDTQSYQLNQDVLNDFDDLRREISDNDDLKANLESLSNKPIIREEGFFSKIKSFFLERKRTREIEKKESLIQDDDVFHKKSLDLIKKYTSNPNVPYLIKSELGFAEKLIQAGLPKDIFLNILLALSRSAEAFSSCNYKVSNMENQLYTNTIIAKELYSPEILYSNSFQETIKNIRMVLAKNTLKEQVPITTEYRSRPLGNRIMSNEDISTILKGKDLSKEAIQEKMDELEKIFQTALQTNNAEEYIRQCTDIMMKFISIHPFDDGNGRTSRMFLQVMLSRRGILFPSNIDNYFERQPTTDYSKMEKHCLMTDDYSQMEEYIIERAKRFNNGVLNLDDTPLTFIRKEKQKTIEEGIVIE